MLRVAVSRAVLRASAQRIAIPKAALSMLYTTEHEWCRLDGDIATVGISDYAQEKLGDVAYVELPDMDASIEKGDVFCVIESVKAASNIYSPITGTVIEVNEVLESSPEVINESAEGDGWLAKFKVDDAGTSDLMDEAAYAEFVAKEREEHGDGE